ncbi:hypothetical protein E4U42_006640 [Claviceps africana]|uniref:Ribosome assembly protein 3 n=1 Tax=Claviceps africana TaxID=83212 RepID=A0A8K0JD78_9HYPO|nr:hypothetical protein E4U42_006640 [Claviceps africana]
MSHPASQATSGDDFTAFYLQQLTQELSNDVDQVRAAEDFKADSVPFLVHALRQGSSQLSPNVEAVAAGDASTAS